MGFLIRKTTGRFRFEILPPLNAVIEVQRTYRIRHKEIENMPFTIADLRQM